MDTPSKDPQETRLGFITRVIETETLWILESEDSTAFADSNVDDDTPVLLVWADRAHAKFARKTVYKEYEVAEVSLFEFVFKWLSGMAEDELLAGVDWAGDLTGPELDPEQLQDEILQAMDEEMRNRYFDALQLELDTDGEGDVPSAT